jgi:hypothetical protein
MTDDEFWQWNNELLMESKICFDALWARERKPEPSPMERLQMLKELGDKSSK